MIDEEYDGEYPYNAAMGTIYEVAENILDACNHGDEILGSKTADPLIRAHGVIADYVLELEQKLKFFEERCEAFMKAKP